MEQQPSSSLLLGQPIRRFERSDMKLLYIMAVMAFLFGIGFLWMTYYFFFVMFLFSSKLLLFAPIAIGMWFWIVFGLLSDARRNAGASIQLCSDGFAYLRGDEVREFRWKDITEMRQTIAFFYRNRESVGSQDRSYHLETQDGRKLHIGNEFKDVAQLGTQIQKGITAVLLPQMIAVYDKGQTVDFGNLNVNKAGVEYKTKYLSWAEIEDAQISRGYVTFKKQGKWVHWARISASKTPNVLVFLALVDHIVRLKSGH